MRDLICIVCPRGCHLKVDDKLNVIGHFCKRGEAYGKAEVTNPTRIITSTVKIRSKTLSRLPVKTDKPIPKEKIFEVMKQINEVEVIPPIKTKQIVIANVLSLGVNIVATRSIEN